MSVTGLLAALAERDIKICLSGDQLEVRAPTGALTSDLRSKLVEHRDEIVALLSDRTDGSREAQYPPLAHDPAERYAPFPLTEIQRAYHIGRTDGFELGGVGIYGYFEFDCIDLDLPRLNRAWGRVIERHDMLRAVVLPDGRQRVLETVPPYQFVIRDLRGATAQDVNAQLAAVRVEMSQKCYSGYEWPMFDVRASVLDERTTRLHVGFDGLNLDLWSSGIVFSDWVAYYRDPDATLPILELTYRDCVLFFENLKAADAHRQSLEYWHRRVGQLPPAPEIPLVKPFESGRAARYVRRTLNLDADVWSRVKQHAARLGLTPAATLLATYAEVLSEWSTGPRFTLNVTVSNRLPLHQQVNQVAGVFTSMILLEVDGSNESTFDARARKLHKQLRRDLEHRVASGIPVLREVARLRNAPTGALFPFVYTAALDTPAYHALSAIGKLGYAVTMTPQVALDLQVFEHQNALLVSWDAAEEFFPPGLIQDAFTAYGGLVRKLADESAWRARSFTLMPEPQQRRRLAVNATQAPVSSMLLHTLFEEQVDRRPDQTAVVTTARTLNYAELDVIANGLARRLQTLGTRRGTLVPIVMHKGWEQIAAVLAVHKAGGAYVPIDAGLPPARIWSLLEDTAANVLLTQSTVDARLSWPTGLTRLRPDADDLVTVDATRLDPVQTSSDLAYVMYTSGSTGMPKGVMIEQASVVNRMSDVATRFGLTPQDRAIGLSGLHHDLSVFDIFGMLSIVGGTIVLPDADGIRDPSHWAALIAHTGVTVWNSVPAFLEMFVEHLESERSQSRAFSHGLRVVILSGDFIPVTLPDRFRALAPGAAVISAGGPTETTVWDICYPIGRVDPAWRSIPYGRPMTNARYHVLKDDLRPAPDWVPGELWAAGVGLARGYWRDDDRTRASFLHHPESGERLYRTGDVGRYLPDGGIEILGRKDFQVKIQGNRIELGEIESALAQHPALRTAVAAVATGSSGAKEIVAYVVPATEAVAQTTVARLQFQLSEPGVRRDLSDRAFVELDRGDEADAGAYLLRRTHRTFLPLPVARRQFGELLACLRQMRFKQSPMPKYRYPSAGGLYPVQVYVYVAPDRVTGIPSGLYYYQPAQHRLLTVSSAGRLNRAHHAPTNQEIFDQAAFSILLIGDLHAIAPLYGSLARDFCLLEAGYMSQLLMTTAPASGLGLCPIGGLDFEPVRNLLALRERHILAHSLVGGPVGANQIDQAASSRSSPAVRPTSDELREFLRARIPAHMMPAQFVTLERLPLGPNGKVDRGALPPIETATAQARTPAARPADELEKGIAAVWEEVLSTPVVDVHRNFFELGGNSLHMVQVHGRLCRWLERQIPVTDLFRHPTIRSLATFLGDKGQRPIDGHAALSRAEARLAARRRRRGPS